MAKDFNISSKVLDTDKYVYREERDLAKTQVDWGAISKNLTDTITTVRDERETQKAEIEKAQTEAMNRAGEFDQYNNKSLNVSVLEGSEWAKNALSTQFDLVRRGLVSPSEYKRYEQRTMDSFGSLKGNLDKFAAHYEEAAQREKDGIANINEQFTNDSLAGLANLSQYQLEGNAATGELYYVKTGNNPETGEPYDPNNPANQISLSVINSRVNQQQDFVKTSDAAKDEVDKLGEVISAEEMARQSVVTMEDWRNLKGSKGMMDGMVQTICGQPQQIVNVLQDRLGYTIDNMTQDPAEAAANPDMILMIPDPDGSGRLVPDFTSENGKKLVAKAEKAARLAIEAQISQKAGFTKGHQVTYKPQPTPTGQGVKDRTDFSTGLIGSIYQLIGGDEAASKAGGTQLANNINKNLPEGTTPVDYIERTAGGESFIVHRVGMKPFEVEKGDMSVDEVVQSIYDNVSPGGKVSETFNTAMDNYTGERLTEFGETATKGIGSQKEMEVINFAITKEQLDNKNPADYVDNMLGVRFRSPGDSEAQVKEVFRNIIQQTLPTDMFDAIDGTKGVVVQVQDEGTDTENDKNLSITVGGTTELIKDYWDETPDYVLKQVEKIMNTERERLEKERGGGKEVGEGDKILDVDVDESIKEAIKAVLGIEIE